MIILLFILSLNCQAQTEDTIYCAPIRQIRLALEDGIRKHEQDTIILELTDALDVKSVQLMQAQDDFKALESNCAHVHALEVQRFEAVERAAEHWQKQTIIADKKWKWGRWGIPVGVVVGFLIAK